MQAADLEGFEAVYRRHVDMVVQGDMQGVLADMAPGSVPAVFKGVDSPRGDAREVEVLAVRLEGERAVGESVYTTTDDRRIGLRSGWYHDGTAWKADALENFAVDAIS